jgi:ABC-type Fe3+/spermidine/putrescine transport system ATPase subunit
MLTSLKGQLQSAWGEFVSLYSGCGKSTILLLAGLDTYPVAPSSSTARVTGPSLEEVCSRTTENISTEERDFFGVRARWPSGAK